MGVMPTPFLTALSLDTLTTSRLWSQLDKDTRLQGATAFYLGESRDREIMEGADGAIASALRFRLQSVKKLKPEKKATYLATSVRPQDALAALLLQSLHLEHHRGIMAAFLDDLGVKNDNGHIADDVDLGTVKPEDLKRAAAKISESFPATEVDVYLASLVAMEPVLWGGLKEVLADRKKG